MYVFLFGCAHLNFSSQGNTPECNLVSFLLTCTPPHQGAQNLGFAHLNFQCQFITPECNLVSFFAYMYTPPHQGHKNLRFARLNFQWQFITPDCNLVSFFLTCTPPQTRGPKTVVFAQLILSDVEYHCAATKVRRILERPVRPRGPGTMLSLRGYERSANFRAPR